MLKKRTKIAVVGLAMFVIITASLAVLTTAAPQGSTYVQDYTNGWLDKPTKEQDGGDQEAGAEAL